MKFYSDPARKPHPLVGEAVHCTDQSLYENSGLF